MVRRYVPFVAVVAVALFGAWLLFVALPRWYRAAPEGGGSAPAAPRPAGAERKITATLFYIAEDGLALVGVQREVPFGEPIVEQARRIVEAQLESAPAPLASAMPAGTTLRGVYLTEPGCDAAAPGCQREAFVDLSPEARARHTGGALQELFTIYAVVNALTVNLPAISRVQILVDGREMDTLAGHVDLRRPLEKNLSWVRTEKEG